MSVDNLTIKEACVDDAEEILAYLKQVGNESNLLSFGKEGIGLSIEQERKFIEKLAVNACSGMFLGSINGEIVSIFNLFQMEKERFNHIAEVGCSVRKAYWHQGIASKMMKHVISYARANKQLRVLELEVLTNNLAAINLYKKFGFCIYGTFNKRMHLDGCDYDSHFMNLYL